MPESFDLTSRPWILCERLDGSVIELSTREVLVEAHALRAIVDPSPLVVAVLHRHLLAVLHRAYAGPKSRKEWVQLVKAGAFDAAQVDAYLERVRDRMDLFHPSHPFAQTRGLVGQFNVDPIDQLDIERSSWGTARSLFQHRAPSYRASMTPAQAARGLLAHHAFATGGLVKKPNEPVSATAAPLVRAAVVILRGPTLFQTLASNLLPYDPEQDQPVPATSADRPSWEQAPPPRQLRQPDEPKRVPLGWLDMLTWLSRRLELVCEGDVVTGYVRAVGQGMVDPPPRDPMVTYRADEKRGFVSVGIDPERAFWRSANALFEAAREGTKRQFERPKAIDLVASLDASSVLDPSTSYTIDVIGLSAEKSRVHVVRAEHVHALARLLDDPAARDEVERALEVAATSVRALEMALGTYARHALAPGGREPDPKDVASFRTSLGSKPAAWSALGVEFEVFLGMLGNDMAAAREHFIARARAVADERFEAATALGDGSARWLKARALGERQLRLSLSTLSPRAPSAPVPSTEEISP